jgi:twitching motility protein PilT
MFRKSGQLFPMEKEEPVSIETLNGVMNSFMGEDEIDKLEKEKEMEIVRDLGENLRFRINVFYQKKLPAVSLYYIPNAILPLSDLKLPKILNSVIQANSGLFVIAGPYGSGKTTTAAAMLEEVNRKESKYIVTLENPIEYLFVGKKSIINQRQVGSDVNSIGEGINYCLQEDIDIVYISEIKSGLQDAMSNIFNLASGNSLVILEINASDSVLAIERLLNAISMGISREVAKYTLADILLGVIAQKLIPARGGQMALACEVLVVNSAVRSMIREGRMEQIPSIIQNSAQEGMVSMQKSIKELNS